MKNVFKRVMAAVLSLIMVLSLAACGAPADDKTTDAPKATDAPATNAPGDNETEAPTDAAEFDPKTITDGVTLTIAVEADDEVIDWETNMTTLMLEEKFGVDLKFEVYAAGSFGDKMNVMINGGDELPDIIFGSGSKGLNSYQANWVQTGAILALNEFYENPDYAKYINIAIEKEGVDFVSTMKDADGNLWAIPKYYPSINDITAQRLWINTEYAKACGFDELPTTTDGFFELCKAFAAAGDLNGNGLDDEVIFTGKEDVDESWFKFLMSPFVYAWDDKRIDVEDGKLVFAYATDGWKEGLKYVKQFFDEGLIDTTILTQDKAAYNTIVKNTDMVVLADFYYNPQMTGTSLETVQYRLAYTALPALEGPSGRIESYYSDPVAYPGAMITADCENPEAAFIVLDYMMSQTMSLYNRYGEEGVDWDYYENVDDAKFIDGTTKDMYRSEADGVSAPEFISYTNTIRWGTGTPQNVGYMLAGPGIHFTVANGRPMVGGANEEAQLNAQFFQYYFGDIIPEVVKYKPEERIITLPMTGEENNEVAEPQKVIDKYWQEASANFLTGVWDIDEYWDTYLAELEKMGMSDLLEIYQTAYDRTK